MYVLELVVVCSQLTLLLVNFLPSGPGSSSLTIRIYTKLSTIESCLSGKTIIYFVRSLVSEDYLQYLEGLPCRTLQWADIYIYFSAGY